MNMFSYELITKDNIRMSKHNLVAYWLIIMIFIILTFFYIKKYNMTWSYENSGIIMGDKKISTIVSTSDVSKIINNDIIKIGDNTFSYKIALISDISNYKEIILETNTKIEDNKPNSIIFYKIENANKNILKEIFKYWIGIK